MDFYIQCKNKMFKEILQISLKRRILINWNLNTNIAINFLSDLRYTACAT